MITFNYICSFFLIVLGFYTIVYGTLDTREIRRLRG